MGNKCVGSKIFSLQRSIKDQSQKIVCHMIFSNTNHPFISPSYWFIRFVSEIQRKNVFKRLISSINLVMFHDLHFCCTTGSLTRATRPVPQVDQELLLCPVHPSSSPVFNGLRSLGFLCSVL